MRTTVIVKRIILSLLLVSTFSMANAQSKAEKEVKAATDQMFNYMTSKNFDGLVDMMYPKVFEIAPKEMLKTSVKIMLEGSAEMSIIFPKEAPEHKISKVYQEKDGLSFAFVTYDLSIQMIFTGQSFDENGKKMMISMMESQGMKMKFVTENKADVQMKNQMTIFINDALTKGKWTNINYDNSNPMFTQMLPSEVAEAAKKYQTELLAQSKKKEKEKKN